MHSGSPDTERDPLESSRRRPFDELVAGQIRPQVSVPRRRRSGVEGHGILGVFQEATQDEVPVVRAMREQRPSCDGNGCFLWRVLPWIVTACLACTAARGASAELKLQLGHSSMVNSVALSPDSRWVLTGGDSTARLWDVSSGREIRRFEGHSGYVSSVAFSPDGRSVLTGSGDHTARLWDVSSG